RDELHAQKGPEERLRELGYITDGQGPPGQQVRKGPLPRAEPVQVDKQENDEEQDGIAAAHREPPPAASGADQLVNADGADQAAPQRQSQGPREEQEYQQEHGEWPAAQAGAPEKQAQRSGDPHDRSEDLAPVSADRPAQRTHHGTSRICSVDEAARS